MFPRCFLLVAAVALLPLFVRAGYAGTMTTLTCDGHQQPAGQDSCKGSDFSFTGDTSASTAGLNSFHNVIDASYSASSGNHVITEVVTTAPQWNPETSVPTALVLGGAVELLSNTSSITFMLTGLLGGPALSITETWNTTGQGGAMVCPVLTDCPVTQMKFDDQPSSESAEETLVITSSEGVIYIGEDVFNGGIGIPEIDPSSAMSALALLSGTLLVVRGRRKKVEPA